MTKPSWEEEFEDYIQSHWVISKEDPMLLWIEDFIRANLISKEDIEKVIGEDETEGILGILATKHRDGLENEVRNKLRAEQRQKLKELTEGKKE